MQVFWNLVQILAVGGLVGGAAMALTNGAPSQPEIPKEMALEGGVGALDGLTFTTEMAPQGQPGAIRDAMFFREGLFLSLECEDRCNYPPSAYYARDVAGGQEFIVEAWCPTKDATMVWRGRIEGDTVSGTVSWSVRRFYWTVGTVLAFSGSLASEAEVAAWRP